MYTRIAVLLGLLALEVLLLSGCASLQPAPAVVKFVSDNEGNSLTMFDAPCTTTAGLFAQLTPEWRKKMKAATAHWKGRDYAACWLDMDAENYFIVDETGDQGVVRKKPQQAPRGTEL